jgi:hypothetical protein
MSLKQINDKIDSLFNDLKGQFLGSSSGKVLLIGHSDKLSLPGIFEEAVKDTEGVADKETVQSLIDIANNYLESEKTKLKARLFNKIKALSNKTSDLDNNDLLLLLEEEIVPIFDNAGSNLERIIDAEGQTAKNIGMIDGLVQMNQDFGIEDPVICFIPTKDNKVCQECIELHTIDGITPKAWKLSEVSYDYHKRGDSVPSINGLHPHCRCQIVSILPGFGFEGGKLRYINKEHNEYDKQHL